MKSCRVQPHSMDGTMDCRRTPSVNMTALICHSPISDGACHLTSRCPRPPARIIPFRDMTSKRFEAGHHANARTVRRQERVSAEGFERN
jgi:hypothetical protein